MYCSKCGNLVLENAKFCQACGTSLNEMEDKKPDSLSPNLSQVEPAPVKSWLLFLRCNPVAGLLVVLLLGLYAAVIIPAFAGIDFDTKRNASSLMFMSGFVFAYLWKKRNRSGWKGFGVGIGAAILVAGIAGGINGFERGRLEGWKTSFIKSCSGGDEAKKAVCACVAEKSNPDYSVQYIKENILPSCLR